MNRKTCRVPSVALLIPFLLLCTAALLTGCRHANSPATPVQVLRYPLSTEPGTLDPTLTDNGDTLEMLRNIYQGLVTYDEQMEIVPCVAERWETGVDGKTITFHLNPKARFHRPFGRQVTAADAKLQPALKDIRVRRAFAMAIDKDEIVRIAYQGLSNRWTTWECRC